MRKVWLRHEEDSPHNADGSLFVQPELVARAAIALATYAVNGDKGRLGGGVDSVFEEVTEGRQTASDTRRAHGSKEVPYSACGDLPAYVLSRLGIVDEHLVNRTDDGGAVAWKSGVNISILASHSSFGHGRIPQRGDPFIIGPDWHTAILEAWRDASGIITSCDYGQYDPKTGARAARRVRTLSKHGTIWLIGSDHRPLYGSIDLTALRYMHPAEVPDDFDEGLPVFDD